MTIFDDYIRNKGCCKVSKTLLWDYDLTQFDWQRSRKVVVQRIIERGWLRDYFAAFDLYGASKASGKSSKRFRHSRHRI